MRRRDSHRRAGRVVFPLCTAGLALVLVVALSPVVRALPVGGSAYYAFLGNITILGIPVPLNIGPAPVAEQPAGGGTNTETLAGLNLGVPITGPTVFSTGAIEAHTEGDPNTNSTLSRATGGQADLFPVPLTGTTGLLRIGGFELECVLNPTVGLTSHAAMGGAESALLPNAIDNALWASPPPNSGMTINGLGEVFWHVVEKEQTATETIYRFDGVRIALNATAIPAGGATGEFIWGHAECAGTRPIPTSVSPSAGPAGTTVTITGTGFIDGPMTSVDFAGVPAADFTVLSDTQIQATVPELRGGTWAVSVTTHVDRGTLPTVYTSDTPPVGTTVDGSAFGVSLQLTPAGLPIGDIGIGPVPAAQLPEGGGS
ncbi:MAG: IPT/TIG domain-containing protein, partial [Vicinamibacteraceae bacterium]